MAETSERPTGVTTGLPPADAVHEEPYRALSLLALAGFSLAVLYAILVLLGGLTPLLRDYPRGVVVLAIMAPLIGAQVVLLRKRRGAAAVAAHAGLGLAALAGVLGVGGLLMYSGTHPWLALEGWGWLIVGAAVFLSWLARSRIAAAEGTLSGGGLANAGLVTGLFFGLVYGAYWLASSFATAGQARLRADEYVELLHKGDPESKLQAFFLTLPARSRPTSNLRHVAEIEYNTGNDPRGAQPGLFTRFSQQQYARLLALPRTTYRFVRVDRKEFERGGFKVELIYQVDAPTGEFEVSIGTIGEDTQDASGRRRQWHIDVTRCGIQRPIHQSPENLELERAFAGARGMAAEWGMKVKYGQVLPAYLDTLPPAARRGMAGDAVLQDPVMMNLVGLPLAGALGASAGGKKFREDLQKYRDGAIVDSSVMWAAREPAKKEMIKEIIDVLHGGVGVSCEITPSDTSVPGFRVNGDEGEFSYPARIMTYRSGEMRGRFVVEADVVVSGPLKTAPVTMSPYRVTKLRLLRGQSAPDPTQQQQSQPRRR
jgi:hypothetical protein